jgi:hypothetical protein
MLVSAGHLFQCSQKLPQGHSLPFLPKSTRLAALLTATEAVHWYLRDTGRVVSRATRQKSPWIITCWLVTAAEKGRPRCGRVLFPLPRPVVIATFCSARNCYSHRILQH